MTSPSPAAPRVSLALLVFIAFSGTLAMHIFVPAMPKALVDLGTDSQTIQLAVTVYILGLALGQLVYGPVSDAIGRRPAVLTGLVIYLLGTIGAYFAADAGTFLAARFVQSLGGAGGLALTRVIVADGAKGVQATRGIAVLNLILLLGPGLAPILGAQISELTGWRSLFIFLGLMSTITLLISLKRLPETGQPSRSLNPRHIGGKFLSLLRNPDFFRVVSGGAFGSTACYAYFVSAPFILNVDMGLSVQVVGYCVGSTLAAAALGSTITRTVVGRISDRAILTVSSGLGALTGTLFLILACLDLLTPARVVGLSLLILLSAGGMGPITIGSSLRLAGKDAGTAAGLFGAAQMLAGVISSFLAGLFSDHALGCGLVLCLGYLFCFLQLRRVRLPKD